MDQIPTSMVAHVVVQTKPSSHGMFESMECTVESVKDFLSKLGIKTRMHLVEISISSLNHVFVRLNKIMNNIVKDRKILTFKVIFQHQKSTGSLKKNSVKINF